MHWFFQLLLRKENLDQGKVERLKAKIRKRLASEDYTCRLPKPRVRYKLTLQLKGSWDGEREVWERVWC